MVLPTPVPGAPGAPMYKRFRSAVGQHVLTVPGSRIYDLDQDEHAATETPRAEWDSLIESLICAADLSDGPAVSLSAVPTPAPQNISLNVSSSCNLACSYCYADGGGFGGAQAELMTWETTRAAIDRLLGGARPDAPITIGFLGGEPFVNRALIHRAVEYASSRARAEALDVRFSVTTNGTLLQQEDIALLREHPFAVTVSVDGGAQVHDRLRPFLRQRGSSFERMVAAVKPLLEQPGRAQVCARATVTRFHLDVGAAFESIARIGFADVGFAPMKAGADRSAVLRAEDWAVYLEHLTALARLQLRDALNGVSLRLTNFAIALKQLHRGACSPYPCGAGGGYFSVAANGDWYTCHRAIGNPKFYAGDNNGLDKGRRIEFLRERHVHAQTDCQQCWARYLCSGSCHQEAPMRTVQSCDFVRGWLEHCLGAYCELSAARPGYWSDAAPAVERMTS